MVNGWLIARSRPSDQPGIARPDTRAISIALTQFRSFPRKRAQAGIQRNAPASQ